MPEKRHSTGRVGVLWRNSRGRALTERGSPRDLMEGRWEPCRCQGERTEGRGAASAKALGWERACMFGKQQERWISVYN